jgi:hypothetical protein
MGKGSQMKLKSAGNSRLMRGKPERADPKRLGHNAGCAYIGSKIYGQGFLVSAEQCDGRKGPGNRGHGRIFPYLGGEEVNTSPTQSPHRHVINFEQMSLEEAGRWPDLLSIVREKVKPERDKNNREQYRKYWWHFGEKRPALYAAIRPLPRCLVTARTSKHVMFSFQPTNRVFSENLVVFAAGAYTFFAAVQSRVHGEWVSLTSSTLEARQGYRPSDCFDTFPFPQPDPRTVIPALETIGEALYEARARYMVDNDVGLTKLYNALKDPSNMDPEIVAIRHLHEEMDRQVLLAYGWHDLAENVPPYYAVDEAWTDEIIDRLFALNAQRAKEEA